MPYIRIRVILGCVVSSTRILYNVHRPSTVVPLHCLSFRNATLKHHETFCRITKQPFTVFISLNIIYSAKYPIILSYYPTILLSYYPTILLSYYPTVLLSYYPTILLSYYPTILLSYYPTILLSYYLSFFLKRFLQ